VGILADAARPLSIPEILGAGERLAQSSVYRNLGVLEHAGAVRRVHGADDFVRYELAEDLTHHHHHLVCVSCGTVADVELSVSLERTVDRAVAAVAATTGFEVHSHRLDLMGRCRGCAEGLTSRGRARP
jgi:Fe2+ or Zn2+ uptake regulation protein